MKTKTKLLQLILLSFAIIAISVVAIGCDLETSAGDTLGAPSVLLTYPSNNATGVGVNSSITATFAESVDLTTITDVTFLLSTGDTAIEGTVTYDIPNKKARFAPTAILNYSTEYSVKLTTGVQNSEDTSMEEDKVWTFTSAAEGTGPSPVNLGTAANYAILAKTGISTVPASVITGDVAVSPAATSYLTGFALTDATGYATSTQVTGFLYGSDMASPTPINLTTAVENMITAYNDAAGRTLPDNSNYYSGALGGLTLAPGLYKWTSTVTIDSDVTISGGADDTWIFQIDGDLSLANAYSVILSGGAQAKNIVWQVAGEVIMGTGAHFEGVVLTQTAVTMNTGATMNGRLLAQTNIALDQATVTEPTD